MPNINYIEIIKSAWQITWKNRFLWWFGLLIALSSGPGVNYGFNSGKKSDFDDASIQKFAEFISMHWQWIITGIIFLAVVVIVLIILGIIARAGLIKSIHYICKNNPGGFKSGMIEGKKYFWRLFFLGIIILVLIFASIFVLAIPVIFLVASKAYASGIFLGFLAFLIFIPVMILVSFLKIFGHFYIVLGDLSMWNALEKAYELFQNNLLASIIMGLLFIPLGIFLMLVILAIIISLAVVFIAIGFMLYAIFGNIGAMISVAIGIICFLAIFVVMRSAYETFAQAAWYLFFSEIAKPKTEARILEKAVEKEEKVLPVADPVKTMEVEK